MAGEQQQGFKDFFTLFIIRTPKLLWTATGLYLAQSFYQNV